MKTLCTDGQVLVDMFVNYDCDLEGQNIFEKVISGLVKTAHGSHTSADLNDKVAANELSERMDSLACLTSIL